MRSAIAAVCANQRSGSGILLDSLLNYPVDSRELVQLHTGLRPAVEVIGIAAASPGEVAGMQIGDIILAVDGFAVEIPGIERNEAQPLSENVQRLIDRPTAGQVRLTIERAGKVKEIELEPESVCDGVIALKVDQGREAYSDDRNIGITSGFVSFLHSPEELAFLIAHELAHTIYEDSGKNGFSRREKERRADAFAVFAMRCAGYRPELGTTILQRLGKADWRTKFGVMTHGSASARLRDIAKVDPGLDCSDSQSLALISQNARS